MVNPAKVIGFLDISHWDPQLAFVMAGALAVTSLGYRWVLSRAKPICEDSFTLPTQRTIDRPLVLGAALFGIGWGLVGLCPAPALVGLVTGELRVALFVISMLTGMWLYSVIKT